MQGEHHGEGAWQRPSVIVAAAERDVGSLLDGAAQLALVDGCLPAGQLAETTVAIRQRLARAADDVRAAEEPVRGTGSWTGDDRAHPGRGV